MNRINEKQFRLNTMQYITAYVANYRLNKFDSFCAFAKVDAKNDRDKHLESILFSSSFIIDGLYYSIYFLFFFITFVPRSFSVLISIKIQTLFSLKSICHLRKINPIVYIDTQIMRRKTVLFKSDLTEKRMAQTH